MMNEKAEHFLLHAISDDWTSLSEFDVILAKLEPEKYSRQFVLDSIRDLGERGLIRFGSFSAPIRPWTPWDMTVTEAVDRIANGYGNKVGYLDLADDEIYMSELLRAEITDSGRARLHQLGDPYDKYGDPWIDDPFSRADP
ncbi:hypothetical protein [Nocardia harenae]|uniref:hypothetical protein n=1 Tax=Nocardia harenae TaxID=358707 RepID=UPI0012EED9D8|nr:hypothetical protein [Nocardia harenae]